MHWIYLYCLQDQLTNSLGSYPSAFNVQKKTQQMALVLIVQFIYNKFTNMDTSPSTIARDYQAM
jgi:hypothetical protein